MSCFIEGFTCGQAVLSTYGTQFGLDRQLALKLATGLGGGLACLGKTCGAVNGALMVIGLKFGRSKLEDIEAKEETYKVTQDFIKRFETINDSIICRDLLGCDISSIEGMNYAEKNDLFKVRCPQFVEDSSKILETIL
ncbi:MAG TPA: C_GCAxxG_C_C family protein [archaeon]|nr:C_GCAxxG_C_C family protein [archaeon]